MVITYNNWSYSNARFALIIEAKVPESHGDIHNYGKHPTPQKINAYIVNKNSKNSILRLSNFRLQNLSNLASAIQIFPRLRKQNSAIFYYYVTFRLTVAQ